MEFKFNDLNDDLKDKVANCKTPEEMLEVAQSEGFELSDEELEAVSGGEDTWDCPRICNQ